MRDKSTTVLLVNPTAEERSLRLQGLKGSSATVRKTTIADDMVASKPQPIVGGALKEVTLPARSVVVVTTTE